MRGIQFLSLRKRLRIEKYASGEKKGRDSNIWLQARKSCSRRRERENVLSTVYAGKDVVTTWREKMSNRQMYQTQ